jgi:hypothetical protein
MLSHEHVRASLILSLDVVGPEKRKILTGFPPHLFLGEMKALADTLTTRRIIDAGCPSGMAQWWTAAGN